MPYTRRAAPYRSTYRSTYKKGTYPKSRVYPKKKTYKKGSRSSDLVLRTPTTVPDRIRLKLSYNSYVSLSGSSGVPFAQVYQNSLFDPDLTGSGNQPLGLDQWAAFYNLYRVNGVSCEVIGCNTNSTTPLTFVLYPSLDPTPPGTTSGVLSTPYAKSVVTSISAGNSKMTLKNYMSTKKIFGFKNIDQNPEFESAVTGSPVNLWYWVLYGYSGTGSVPTFQGTVKLTFYCELYDRVQLNIS